MHFCNCILIIKLVSAHTMHSVLYSVIEYVVMLIVFFTKTAYFAIVNEVE